jgi:hypothetical protein
LGLSAWLWFIDRHIATVVETRTLSPYVICTARNPSS